MKSLYEAQDIYIVSETVNGETVETRLPKEKAETLYRKLRAKGAKADIKPEVIKEEPYIPAFEIES